MSYTHVYRFNLDFHINKDEESEWEGKENFEEKGIWQEQKMDSITLAMNTHWSLKHIKRYLGLLWYYDMVCEWQIWQIFSSPI